jgi:hypothetical protein
VTNPQPPEVSEPVVPDAVPDALAVAPDPVSVAEPAAEEVPAAEAAPAAPEPAAEPISPLQVAAQVRASVESLGNELSVLAAKVTANEIPFKQANAELERLRGVIAAGPVVGVPEELSAQLTAVEEALKAAAEAHRAARAAAAAVARTT